MNKLVRALQCLTAMAGIGRSVSIVAYVAIDITNSLFPYCLHGMTWVHCIKSCLLYLPKRKSAADAGPSQPKAKVPRVQVAEGGQGAGALESRATGVRMSELQAGKAPVARMW